jgi:hypothetical protein
VARIAGIAVLIVAGVGIPWIFLPLFRTDPVAASRLSIPNPSALVLTDKTLRVYRYFGAVSADLQELVHRYPRADVVGVAGPTLAITGSYKAHRIAVEFRDGKLLVADVRDGEEVHAAGRIMVTLKRRVL